MKSALPLAYIWVLQLFIRHNVAAMVAGGASMALAVLAVLGGHNHHAVLNVPMFHIVAGKLKAGL